MILTVLLATFFLLAPTALKWVLYEQSDAAPRLRSLIGTEVTLPQQTLRILGRDVKFGPHTGTLTSVDYRMNDRWGWFDLKVEVQAKDGNGSASTGLSPADAAHVTVAPGR